jgi:dynein heavy chain
MAVVFRRPTVFLITEAHVVVESFLETINALLSDGFVPSLWEKDEMEAVINDHRQASPRGGAGGRRHRLVTPPCAQEAIAALCAGSLTNKEVLSHYMGVCRSNLHVVLAMSPSGSKLRVRCRQFPGPSCVCARGVCVSSPASTHAGLLSYTSIDYFLPWPSEALTQVANFHLANCDLGESPAVRCSGAAARQRRCA